MTHVNYVSLPPPIESLLENRFEVTYWPRALVNQPGFQRHLQTQRDLLQRLRVIYAALPTKMTLEQGLIAGLVTSDQVTLLCLALAKQLERDPAQQRLSLYLPVELLSPISRGLPGVIGAALRLKKAYRRAWEKQLTQYEVRANYVDGDVLEPELRTGDHPRVVKAAHLIPDLLRVGHLSVPEVLAYQQQAVDPLLKQSIGDACTVAAEMGLFPREQISPYPQHRHEQSVLATLTEGRARWLATVEVAKRRASEAVQLAERLKQGGYISQVAVNIPDDAICLEAVRLATLQDSAVLSWHKDWITEVSKITASPEVRANLQKLAAHLFATALVDRDDLKKWGVTIPDLGGSFFANLHRLQPASEAVLETSARISKHQRLGQLVYPVTLIFGSQIKGYGLEEADCDAAVFVRPGVHRSEQAYLQQELALIFNDEHFGGKVVLFWLEENRERLRVIDRPEPTYSDGESSWIHVLFGALWFGQEKTIKMLYEQLLVTYFRTSNSLLAGKPVYERWLEEMERDTLQYRLLHKGFERFYPIASSIDVPSGELIDGHAAFYDPQYRRIATELYVRRVWLPQL